MTKEFGPNQDRVDALLARLETVDQPQAMYLASFGQDDPERRRARQAMLEAAHRGGREKPLRAAQDEVRRWVNTWFSGGPQLAAYGRDITPAEAAVDAAPVVLDAVGALVVSDLLSDQNLETLTEPWRELLAGPGPVDGSAIG